MKYFSLQKYLGIALKFFIPFIFILTLCIILLINNGETIKITISVALFITILLLGLPAIYYFTLYLIFRKKCKKYTPREGVVYNWEIGFFRYSGSVIVKDEDTEYSSSAYFYRDDAKELVGKTISYAIIDETLFIYEIKN